MLTTLDLAYYELGLRVGQGHECFKVGWEQDAEDCAVRLRVALNLDNAVRNLRSRLRLDEETHRDFQRHGREIYQITRTINGDGFERGRLSMILTHIAGIESCVSAKRRSPLSAVRKNYTWYLLGKEIGISEIIAESLGTIPNNFPRESAIWNHCRELHIQLQDILPERLTQEEDRGIQPWPDYWRGWYLLEVSLARLATHAVEAIPAEVPTASGAQPPAVFQSADYLGISYSPEELKVRRERYTESVRFESATLLWQVFLKLIKSRSEPVGNENLTAAWHAAGRALPSRDAMDQAVRQLKSRLKVLDLTVEVPKKGSKKIVVITDDH